MKIACPECGQHYEVDASMLDRYFRCTECKTLFRGLNAKSVKIQQFKRKKRKDGDAVNESSDLVQAEPGDTAAAVVLESDELARATVDIDGEEMPEAHLVSDGSDDVFDDEEAISEARKEVSLQIDWNRCGMIAALVLAGLSLVLLMVCMFRLSKADDDLQRSWSRIGELEKLLQNNNDNLQMSQQAIQLLKNQLTNIEEKMSEQFMTKSDVSKRLGDTADQFAHINDRINDIVKEVVNIGEYQSRLEELEKLMESLRRRSPAQSNYVRYGN